MTVSNYSTTADSNSTINSINIAEGCPPSTINNAIRNELADLRTYLNDSSWFIVGDGDGACTFTYSSGTAVTVASTDVTTAYHANRRCKIVGSSSGTLYGFIASSSFSTNTTINFTFDSGSISASDATVDVYLGSPYTNIATSNIPATAVSAKTTITSIDSANDYMLIWDATDSALKKATVANTVTHQDLDFEGDSGSSSVDLDSQSLDIAGGSGITTTASGQTLTVAGDDATTSAKGVASFDTNNFSVSSGAVSIKTGGVENAELANSTVAYGGISLALGGADTTPAFDLTDATNYPTSSLTGTITNAQLAGSITNAKLTNSSVNYGGVSLSLGGSDTTPAFDLTDATNYPTSSLSGTITNAQLAGSIANAKLSNSSVSYGGISLSLGGSDSTPAFDLTDATNYPTSSLTGTITNAQLAGSIANAKLSNSSVSYGGVSLSLGGSDSTPAFDLTDATNYPSSSLSGTISGSQLANTAVTAGSYTKTNITVDAQGRITSAASGTSSGSGISWQAVITADPSNATAGYGYFCNTTGAAFTVTLPTSATIGDEICFIDYAGTFDSNNLTIGRNSHNIQGTGANLTVATERAAFTLVYVDATQGWLLKDK